MNGRVHKSGWCTSSKANAPSTRPQPELRDAANAPKEIMAQVAITGDHAPPTHHHTADIALPDAVSNKRKRDDGADVSGESTTPELRTRQIQKDILHVLGQYVETTYHTRGQS